MQPQYGAMMTYNVPGHERGAQVSGKATQKQQEKRQNLKWNFRMSTLDGMFANVGMGMVTPFLAVYVMALGGSNHAVGLITAMPALMNTLMYLPAASIVERSSSRLKIATKTHFLAKSVYILMALVPFLPWPNLRPGALIALIGLQTVPTVVTMVAWTTLMGDTFPREERAHLLALRSMYTSLVTLVSSLLAGVLLDAIAYPVNYVALFVISYGASLLSLYFLSKMKEPPVVPVKTVSTSLGKRIKRPFADPEYGPKFRVFVISAALVHFGINLAVPAYSIMYVRDLGLSNAAIGSLSLAGGLTAVLAYPMWGVVSRKAGEAAVYALSLIAFAVYPVVYGLNGSLVYLLILKAAMGIFDAGFAFTLFNLTLEYVNPEDSANGIAVFNVLINATGIIGPPIAALVISQKGVMGAYIVSTIVRTAGCVIFLKAFGIQNTLGRMHRSLKLSISRRRITKKETRGVL
jgi:MFS family permease